MKRLFVFGLLTLASACPHHDAEDESLTKEIDGNEKAAFMAGADSDDLLVLECQMETADQRAVLYRLVQEHDLDLWAEGIPQVGSTFSMLLQEEQLGLLMSEFACHKAKSLGQYRLERLSHGRTDNNNNYDYGGNVFSSLIAYNKTNAALENGFYSNYQSYTNIMTELKRLSKSPQGRYLVVKSGSIGNSVDGRTIPVLHLRSNVTNPDRPAIWLSGGQHAREWVAISSVMYVLDRLIGLYGKNDLVTTALDSFEFVIAPALNPDGYEWSRNRDRLWRKNRARNTDGTMGVDLNRNWDSHWGEVGSSKVPGMQTYQGKSPASEPEVRLTSAYIKSLKNRAAGIDVHSFGQLVMRNYGWTYQATSKEAYLKRLGDSIADAMNALYSSDYKSQRSSALYPSGGSMDDWMFDKAEMPGFTIELRDHGEYGFVLPPEYIIPTGEELLAGVLALSQALLQGREM